MTESTSPTDDHRCCGKREKTMKKTSPRAACVSQPEPRPPSHGWPHAPSAGGGSVGTSCRLRWEDRGTSAHRREDNSVLILE